MIGLPTEVRMSAHDVVSLNHSFETWKRERGGDLAGIEPFLYYSVEHITKLHSLTDEQVRYGITDGANDGGIDAIYCLAGNSNTLLRDDAPIPHTDSIRVMMFQVKSSLTETGFKAADIDQMAHFTEDLLNMSRPLTEIEAKYNRALLSILATFKSAFSTLAHTFPKLRLEFYYITRGDGDLLNAASKAATARLDATVQKHRGTDEKPKFVLVDTPKLLAYVQTRRQTERKLLWARQPVEVSKGNYVGLVKIRDYFDFLMERNTGRLDELIFESNVRGHQGKKGVNKAMLDSLNAGGPPNFCQPSKGGPPDFWQLNNGITITCSDVGMIDFGSVCVKDAQVVNGLQTSRQIFAYLSDIKQEDRKKEERMALVKLMTVTDEKQRDQIIRATNSQTPIKQATLRLTGQVHRDIESMFANHGYFYDRRPGFYKDKEKPIDKIIAPNELGQAVIAILLHRPDDARARPGKYLNAKDGGTDGKDAKKVKPLFKRSPEAMNAYLKSILIVKHVSSYLRTHVEDSGDRRNLVFYVALYTTATLCGTSTPDEQSLSPLTSADFTKDAMKEALSAVNSIYRRLVQIGDNPDTVAKGTAMLEEMKTSLPGPTEPREVQQRKKSKKVKDVLSGAIFAW